MQLTYKVLKVKQYNSDPEQMQPVEGIENSGVACF